VFRTKRFGATLYIAFFKFKVLGLEPQLNMASSGGDRHDKNWRLFCDSLHQPPLLPTLPYDVILEILCRLPVKFILRFRCVCKSWNSLISDPIFVKKQLSVSTTRNLHFLNYANDSGKSSKFVKDKILKISEGMIPLRLLSEKLKNCNFWQLLIFGGIFPSNLFSDNPKKYNWLRLPMKAGIFPDNLFKPNTNFCIFWNFPKVVGIVPSKWLYAMFKSLKPIRNFNP